MKTSTLRIKILVVVLLMQMNDFLFAQHFVIPLWNNGVPNAVEATNFKEELEYEHHEVIRIRKVSEPTLTVYLPKKIELMVLP